MRKFLTIASALAIATVALVAPASAASAASGTTTVSAKAASSTVVRGSTEKLTVTVKTGSRAATGMVYVYDGSKKVKTLTLSKGKATYTTSKTAARGVHKFKFVHAKTKKSKTVSVTVKSKVAWSVNATTTTYTRQSSLPKINVTTTADGKAVDGTVYVREGARTVASAKTSGGKASIQVPATLVQGNHTLTTSFTTATKYVVPPAAKNITFTAKSQVVWSVSATATTYTREELRPTINVAATVDGKAVDGNVYVREGSLTVAFASTSSGKAAIQVPAALEKGTHTLTVSFGADSAYLVAPATVSLTFTTKSTAVIPGDGIYLVGSAVQPGLYVSKGSNSGCYWARESGLSGDLDDIIANDYANGTRYVRIAASDVAFETDGCLPWSVAPTSGTPATSIDRDGQLRVGIDIAPGIYVSDGTGDLCYWERLSDATGSFADIIANDLGDGMRIMQIQPTDAFVSVSGCGSWTKIG